MLITKIKQRRVKKAIAVFMLLTIVNQVLTPTIAYALTSGPTAPEATSFEPIDTTDMVNTLTGNFTYGLPLLEVPGPEGGYPLSMAYHAGIQPNEDASWVGLGWSLNPGAISRSVNGFADDFSDVNNSRRDYWAGGSRSTFNIGVGLYSGVSFGLSFSQDTYQGFGVGVSAGYGYKIGPITVGGNISISPFGGAALGITAGAKSAVGKTGLGLGGNLGISTNFESISGNVGTGLYGDGMSLLGSSINTNNSKASLSVGGGSTSVYNARAGKISTSSSGFGFSMPFGLFSVSIGYNYTKYWSDETANILTNGSIYAPQRISDQSYFTTRTYDNYRLLDPLNSNIVDNPDPDKLQGGTFPDYDNYLVTAQGLGGSIRPYIFQSVLYTQNQTDIVQTSGAPANGLTYASGIQYRFINDFSNSYRQDHSDMNSLGFQFGNPTYGNNDGNYGYSTQTNKLSGSKNIAYFTNAQINSNEAKLNGFINVPENNGGFIRMGKSGALSNTKGSSQIGGFTITNESGVSYHYALPAYERGDYSKISQKSGVAYTSESKFEPYAYTWYLTAITGADFVDKNNNGLADENDWGYWVTFDYGKWTSDYYWRNPSEGTHTDIDPNYVSYSQGTKELYYLDAIKTRSHTALFVKEVRLDAMSLGIDFEHFDFETSASTLGLSYILLLRNDQINSSVNTMRSAASVITNSGTDTNVIDVNDVNALTENLNQKSLRKIALAHDYSLVPGTAGSNVDGLPANPTYGKYSLLSVDFQGKGGAAITPPVRFQYDFDTSIPANNDIVNVTSTPSNGFGTIEIQTANKFKPGDILKIITGTTIYSSVYYCTLLSSADNKNFNVQYLVSSRAGLGPAVSGVPSGPVAGLAVFRTKNPPYNKDAVDGWGMYKSDYKPINNNENQSRLTSEISNKSVDVWSLRSIQTSVGASFNINYEGDNYRSAVLNKSKSVIINGGTFDLSANKITVDVPNPQNLDLHAIYTIGQNIDGVFLYSRVINITGHGTITINDKKAIAINSYHPAIVSISGNTLQISVDAQFFADLKTVNPSSVPQGGTVNSVTCTQLTGNLESFSYGAVPGGGIRVKDLIVDDLNGSVRKTSYDYNMLGQSVIAGISSGVTSYEPVTLDADNIYNYLNSTITSEKAVINDYHRLLYNGVSTVLTLARDAPAPGVMYEYITTADADILPNGTEIPVEGKTTYQYRVFNKGMIGIVQYQNTQQTSTLYQKNISIKDYTSQIGNLVRTIRYDKDGNKLAETINHYLNDDIVDKPFGFQDAAYESRLSDYNYQGFIQERYADGRSMRDGSNWIYKLTMSGRDQYPIIGTGTTQIDYLNGRTVDRQDLAFDFYSGVVTKTLNSDSYGNRFINEVIPAYHQYPAMGVRVSNGITPLANKNMLTQEAANYTYAVDVSNNPIGVIAATAKTWSNTISILDPDGNVATVGQADIWRMGAVYNWLKSGNSTNNLTPYASFADFFASGGSANPSWIKTSEITQYNVYSAALEASDINNNYAATRMGYSNSKVLISGGPARYNEIAYAGAEDVLLSNGNFSSNISKGTGTIVTDSTKAHTGLGSLLVPPLSSGFTYTVAGIAKKNYSVAVWVKPTSANAGQAQLYYQVGTNPAVQATATLGKSAAGWYLLEMTIPSNAITGSDNLVVGCKNGSSADLYFDDFKFQPTASSATAYVYDKKTGELTYIIGNNNLFTRFQYDEIGRLVRTYREILGKTNIPIVSSTVYHYGKSTI